MGGTPVQITVMTPALPAGRLPVASKPVETAPSPTARRANLEDLPALLALWEKFQLPGTQLEKFLTEFQVIADVDGRLLAAIGLQIDGDEALIHSEAIDADNAADECRLALWTRMQIVLRNQGVQRVWTLEDAEYWASVFQPADPGEAATLKAAFADPTASWMMLRLLDDARVAKLVNEQVVLRGGTLDGDRAEFAETVRKAKIIAYAIATVVILLLVAFAGYLLVHREELHRAMLHRAISH